MQALEEKRTHKQRLASEMPCRADWYARPKLRASRGREGSAEDALQFNPPIQPLAVAENSDFSPLRLTDHCDFLMIRKLSLPPISNLEDSYGPFSVLVLTRALPPLFSAALAP